MELSSANHNEPHAPSRIVPPGEKFDIGHAFIKQIMECLEESIQEIRRDHKNTENWMFGLKQEEQKAMGEILGSCKRMESDIGLCRGLLNDVINKGCLQPGDSHGKVDDGAIPKAVGEQAQTHNSGESLPAFAGMKTNGTQEILSMFMNSQLPKLSSYSHPSDIHTQMLRRIESRERQREQVKCYVEAHCRCSHSQFVPSFLVRLTHSNAFNNVCATITVAFAVIVGLEADIQIRAALDGQRFPSWLQPVVHCFNLWFIAEVTLRVGTDGVHYFLDANNWRWNVFDLIIAALSFVDMLAGTGSFGFVRLIRALKIAKALRVVRLLGMFRDLRLLIASMLTSLTSLVWSVIFLVMVIYLAAVTVVEAAAVYVTEEDNPNVAPIQNHYSSLSQAMYTLLMCITGGMDWSEAAYPTWYIGTFYGCTFMFYILFCVLGILNVITSIFVEHASTMKKHDRDYAVSEELRAMQEEIEATLELFDTLVENGIREITTDHLEEILLDKRVIAHFASIGIEICDRGFITQILGDKAGGLVDTRAFLHGCLSLRGTAKQSDMQSIILHVKQLESVMEVMRQDTMENFKLLAQLTRKSIRSGKLSGRDDKHVESHDWGHFGLNCEHVVLGVTSDEHPLMKSNQVIESL